MLTGSKDPSPQFPGLGHIGLFGHIGHMGHIDQASTRSGRRQHDDILRRQAPGANPPGPMALSSAREKRTVKS